MIDLWTPFLKKSLDQIFRMIFNTIKLFQSYHVVCCWLSLPFLPLMLIPKVQAVLITAQDSWAEKRKNNKQVHVTLYSYSVFIVARQSEYCFKNGGPLLLIAERQTILLYWFLCHGLYDCISLDVVNRKQWKNNNVLLIITIEVLPPCYDQTV